MIQGTPTLPSLDVESLRADFPILGTKLRGDTPLIYLDNAATTQRPRQVIQKIVETYERHYANVHRGVHWLSDQTTDLYEEAREKVRCFLNAADREEVIFTRGTTEAINLVARSWGDEYVHEGDEIVITDMEHHSNIVPWQQLAERAGGRIRWIPITDDGLLDLNQLDGLITPRVKMIAVTSVSNVLGTVVPLERVIAAARRVGARVLVDAAQHVPHQPLDVRRLGVDFAAFSGHKMLAPSGIGVLYGRRELLEAMPPFMGGGSMIRRVKHEGFEPADLPAKFEPGTPSIVSAIALGTAIDYLEKVGWPAIHEYCRRLAAQAHQILGGIAGLRILGPDLDQKAAIVSFTLDGIHAHDIAQILDRHGVAVRAGHHCAMPLHKRLGINASTRASFYFYNTLAEVDALARAIEDTKRVFRRK
jgi:cysteine desulfurase/selenocysteine lyase